MFKTTKSEELEQALAKMGRKDLGLFFSMNGSEMLSCSCGHHKKIKEKDIESRFENSDGRYVTMYKCPFCGTDAIIPYADVEGSNVPILYRHDILRDDAGFFVLSLDVTWIHLDINDAESNTSVAQIPNEESVIVLDKANRFLFVAPRENWNLLSNREWWQDCQSLEYRDGHAYGPDGTAITEICDACYLTENNDYYMDYPLDAHMAELSGMAGILRLIADKAGANMVDLDFDDGFESVLSDIIYRVDFKWHESWEDALSANESARNLKGFGPDRDRPVHSWFDLASHGFRMDTESFEQAAGVPANVLKDCTGWDEYDAVKAATSAFQENGISDISRKWLADDVPSDCWNRVVAIAKKTGTDLDTAIRHFHRGKENGFGARDMLHCYEGYIRKGMAGQINLNGAFTQKTWRHCELVMDGVMSQEQYQRIAERPTLDTFLKAMGIAV